MKPAKKKQIDSNKSLKQTHSFSKNSSTSKINAYFKPALKSSGVEAESKEDDSIGQKQYYIQILKEKLQTINGSAGNDVNPTDGADDVNPTDGAGDVNPTDGAGNVVNPTDGASSARIEKEIDYVQKAGANSCERKECTELQQKYRDMKRLYLQLTAHYSELDMKHKNLLKRITGKHDVNSVDSTSSTVVVTTSSTAVLTASSTAVSTASSTENFNGNTAVAVKTDIFTPNETKFLESIGLEKSKDSTFVLQCLQYLYKSDPNVLATKSLFGTKDSTKFAKDGTQVHCPGKQPITPTKAIRIKQLFVERISKCGINSVEYGERMREPYVHKLLASAIKNMSK